MRLSAFQAYRCVVLGLLLPAAAVAQSPTPASTQLIYAVHPLNVVEAAGPQEVSGLQAVFAAQLAKLGLRTAEPACVQKFLAKRGQPSCEDDDTCLVDLGESCGADRVLWVSVAPDSSRSTLRLSGKVVRSDGLAGTNSLEAVVPKSKKPRHQEISEALAAFLSQLTSMGFAPATYPRPHPSAQGPQQPDLSPHNLPAQTAATSAQPALGHRLRVVGLAVGVAGVLALGAAGALDLSAAQDRSALKKLLDANGQVPTTAQAIALVDSLRTRSAWATAALTGGTILTATGLLLSFLPLRYETKELGPTVELCPTIGPGLAVAGRF